MTYHLVMMRHGESMGNSWKPAYQNEDFNFLSPLGMAQAQTAGLRLARVGYQFSTVAASKLTRARETTIHVMRALGDWRRAYVVDHRLNEFAQIGHSSDPSYPAGESRSDHHWRVGRVLLDTIKPALATGHVLVVSHHYTMVSLIKHLGFKDDGELIGHAEPHVYDPELNRFYELNDREMVVQH